MTATVTPAPPPLLTAEEFVRRHAGDRFELVEGHLEEVMPGGARHGEVCGAATDLIRGYVKPRQLGLVCTNDTFVLTGRSPDRVRGADVVYWSSTRWPSGRAPDGMIEVPPDLVIEVKSPTDRWAAVTAKVGEYLLGGVGVVVVVDPKTATATAHRADEFHQTFHNGDEFTLPDVLPGFAAPVARFFD